MKQRNSVASIINTTEKSKEYKRVFECLRNPRKIAGQNIPGSWGRRGIATTVVALVVIIIVLAAALGYYALAVKTSTITSVVTNAGSTPSTVVTTVSGTPTTVVSTVTSSCGATPLLLYTADAYVNEIADLESNFAASTCVPAVTAQDQGAGALAALIKAGDPVSVFMSVAKATVESGGLGPEYPGWAISFAADSMALAYTSASTSSSGAQAVLAAYNTATTSNSSSAWYTFFNDLTSGSVKVGISNPNLDPAGFRAWLVLQLAGIAYGNGGTGGTAYQQSFVNNLLKDDANVTGPSAAALVPALSTGQINFLFIYKSAVASNGLSAIELPNGINLGVVSYNSYYARATYSTTGGLETGAAIALWLSVPKDATNPTGSVDFVVYTVQNYQKVLQNFGLTPIAPAQLYVDSNVTLPSPIAALEAGGALVNAGTL
jgi:molybdate/tungstate transport system substrate-binding protein